VEDGGADALGLEQADHGLHQGVVEASPTEPDEGWMPSSSRCSVKGHRCTDCPRPVTDELTEHRPVSAYSADVVPGRSPASTSAYSTQRRTVSRQAPPDARLPHCGSWRAARRADSGVAPLL
jgi:hypothetical protein